MKVDRLTDAIAEHGEGPVWSPSWGSLRWVDMTAGDILSLNTDGSVTRTHVGTIAAAVRPRDGGGAVIAVEQGFLLEEPDGTTKLLPPVWTDPTIRMNEGGYAPDGSFYSWSPEAGLHDRRPFVTLLDEGRPDGLTVDAEGGIWAAVISRGAVHRYPPDGVLDTVSDIPGPQSHRLHLRRRRPRHPVRHHHPGGFGTGR